MKYQLNNNSNLDMTSVGPLFNSFIPFAAKYLGLSKYPVINLASDAKNAQLPLGKTGFYDPTGGSITIYTDNRHIKDILRSLSHEMVHHSQNLEGKFNISGKLGSGYAQKDPHLRDMERHAYEKGNLCLRDWEDTHKKQFQESIYYKGENLKMSYKNWRNQKMNSLLLEKWSYRREDEESLEETEDIVEGHGCECADAHPGITHDAHMLSIRPLEEVEELEEQKIRETIRKAITKSMKNRRKK
jgi:hypothetical protein